MLRRLLDRPCTLALLIGFQFAFMVYFSFGGFRNLTSIFGRDSNPTFDYSRTHDVYTNLSLLPQRLPRGGPTRALPVCPERSPYLVGPLTVSFSRVPTLAQIQEKNPAVGAGGRYRPASCEPRSRTAVVIPHRNRETHLGHLLYYLHPFLQRQQLQYGIYVVHQVGALEQGARADRSSHSNAFLNGDDTHTLCPGGSHKEAGASLACPLSGGEDLVPLSVGGRIAPTHRPLRNLSRVVGAMEERVRG
uniref:Galactosyltransferase N-terminal domain-containing protein n=1 Tax=Sphenodon punctatus TaxID=8508 RepID=A0A8D0GQW7_SPHPU